MRSSKKTKNNKKIRMLYFFIFLLVCLMTLFILHSISLLTGIENKIRLLLSIDLGVITVFCLFLSIKFFKQNDKSHILFVIFFTIYSILLGVGAFYIRKTYKVIDKISASSTTYYSSLITLKDNKVDSISDMAGGTIGYLSDTTSVDGNQIPKEILKSEKIKNNTKEYDNYVDLIDALLDNKVEYIFVPSNYALMFSNVDEADFENLEDETKVLYTKQKDISNVTNKNTTLSKPFTVLIMGVDSEQENIKGSTFNGDALMLLTFNPETLNTTILSIPRDTYVPIACFSGKAKNKITHAAWYGADCMMNTIEDFLDVEIDYYVKINFKGVVKLIDTLGGVEIDVPYSFCEQDSNRRFGKNTVYVKKGLQKLNGEQALALSRNRKSNSNKCSSEWTQGVRNDFVRGQNQQLVLRGLLNELKSVKSLDTVYNLLNTISNNMETNMTTDEILSLYNVGKDILVKASDSKVEDLIGMQRLYLNGKDTYIYDSRSGLNLYNYVLYNNSVKAVQNALKVNLELTKPTMAKTFSFDVNEAYEPNIIGKNETGMASVTKLPSFIGLDEAGATKKANSLGIKVTFKYVTTGTGTNLTVINQSVMAGVDVSTVKSLTLTVLKKEIVTIPNISAEKETDTSKDNNIDTTDVGSSGVTNSGIN